MDVTAAAQPTGLVGWVIANGQIVLFFVQIIFWIAVGVAALWAAMVFSRYTKFMMSDAAFGMGDLVPVEEIEETTVSVDEFVE